MEAKTAIHYFFNNDFKQAKRLMKPWAENSMYHSLGTSVFAFLEAILTFEQVIMIHCMSHTGYEPNIVLCLHYVQVSSIINNKL